MAAPATAEPRDISIIPADALLAEISAVIAKSSKEVACCFDAKSLPILARSVSAGHNKIAELRSRGVRLRCVTEIMQDDLPQCKELISDFEVFHIERLTGSFLISDGRDYLGFLIDSNGQGRILRILDSSFVTSQLFLLDTVIEKALPAKQRIIEIVRGTGGEFIETIRDPIKARLLTLDLIRSSIYEIDVLFSTKNSFLMAEREGILGEIGRMSSRGIKVRLLVMHDETIKENSEAGQKIPYDDVQINFLQQFLPTKITTVIIDQSKSLTVEVNDDTKDTFQEAVGLSTYSNSESTVFSNASIFESLWIQSELEKQNKARRAYFQLFKGFKLKDEKYDRRWSSGEKKDDNENQQRG